ncbi:hypothetical protein J3R82DRAFT_8973 [Butyriboletus roseoflavus]|nr:hypothetical protein J3R82DRAFT_8973 [Butyriboletus roseoflavus]
MGTVEDIEGSSLAPEKHGQGKDLSQDVQGGESKEGPTTPARKVEGGYGGEYHPAQLHPPPPGASVAEYQSSLGAQQQGQDLSTTNTGKPAPVGAEKPGFITLVKGEMKILAGKMSGDEHKVEEGKKLVHGEARFHVYLPLFKPLGIASTRCHEDMGTKTIESEAK